MRRFQRIIYRLKIFLRLQKPCKPQPPIYFKVTAINKTEEPEEKTQVAFVKTEGGRTISFNHVPGATGYRINGKRTEIIAIK